MAKSKAFCFNCLIPHHRARDCKRKPSCNQCNSKHSSLLHFNVVQSASHDQNVNQRVIDANQNVVQSASHDQNVNQRVIDANQNATPSGNNGFVGTSGKTKSNSNIGLPILPVKIKANDKCVVTYAFLDCGSNSTFCSVELLKQLDVKGKSINFSLTTLEKENRSLKVKP